MPWGPQAGPSEPDNSDAWRVRAEARLSKGRSEDAANAIKQGIERRPEDVTLLVDLAHLTHAAGNTDAAIGTLEQVLELDFGNVAALLGLVGMYREANRLEDALRAGRKVVAYRPEDVLTALDVAELTLALDRMEEAVEAFRWLRDIDDEPDHEVYAMHGMIEAELRRERWRIALDLAVDATRVDRFGPPTDILALPSRSLGVGDRPAPSRRDVDAALAASGDEHRRPMPRLALRPQPHRRPRPTRSSGRVARPARPSCTTSG
jgi:tetratricopeptide (TPR) repeat protein